MSSGVITQYVEYIPSPLPLFWTTRLICSVQAPLRVISAALEHILEHQVIFSSKWLLMDKRWPMPFWAVTISSCTEIRSEMSSFVHWKWKWNSSEVWQDPIPYSFLHNTKCYLTLKLEILQVLVTAWNAEVENMSGKNNLDPYALNGNIFRALMPQMPHVKTVAIVPQANIFMDAPRKQIASALPA